MKKPNTRRTYGTLTAKKLDDIELPREVLAALAPHPAEAPLNAAQHHELARAAVRYRCTVGSLLVALAFGFLEKYATYGDCAKGNQDEAVLDALMRYSEGGMTPKGTTCYGLPAVVDQCSPEEHRGHRIDAHRFDGAMLLYAEGKISPDEFERLTA